MTNTVRSSGRVRSQTRRLTPIFIWTASASLILVTLLVLVDVGSLCNAGRMPRFLCFGRPKTNTHASDHAIPTQTAVVKQELPPVRHNIHPSGPTDYGQGTMSTKQLVQSTIQGNKVVVFSKSYCPYCAKAKSTLQKYLKDFFVMELDQRPDGDDIQNELASVTGGRSVPRVFIGGQFIGGGDDTVRLAQTGELNKLLQQAGAV